MNKIAYIPFALVCAATVAFAEDATNLVAEVTAPVEKQDAGASRWRLSVGARFAPGVKARAATSRHAYSTLSGKMSFAGLEAKSTRSSTSAKSSLSSVTENGTLAPEDGRYTFDAGFIDMNDAAGIDGETWNWHLDDSVSFDESTGTFTIPMGTSAPSSSDSRRSATSHASESYDASGTSDCLNDDLWGIDAEIGYDFHRSGRWTFGAGLGFAFYRDADSFRVAGRCRDTSLARTLTQTAVDSASVITEKAMLTDSYYAGEGATADLLNDDGSYGAGTFDGYANPYGGNNPVLSVSGISTEKTTDTATLTTTRTTATRSSMTVDLISEGSVSTWETRLALQPAFRVADWLELRGTLGAVMTYVDIDVDSDVFVNGTVCRRLSTCDSGYVFAGLCGLDALFSPFNGFDVFVGADIRLGSNSMDFDTGLARGTVELARATYRAGIAVQF